MNPQRPDRPTDTEPAQLPLLPEPKALSEREAFEHMALAQRMTFDSAMADKNLATCVRVYTEALNARRRKEHS